MRVMRRCWSRWAACRADSGCRMPACRFTPKPMSSMRSGGLPERRRSPHEAFLSDLRDLKVGDLVVHVDHGIGAFVGLKQIGVGGDAPRNSWSSAMRAKTSCSFRSSDSTWCRNTPARTQPPHRSARRHVVGAGEDEGQEGHARHGRGAVEALRRAQGGPRPRVPRRLALAAGVRGRVPVRAHARSDDGHRRHQARHGVADADGPAALRRRRLRQDRSRDARGVQGRDGRQAGGLSRADDRSGLSAREDAQGALRRVSGPNRHGEPFPDARRSRSSRSTDLAAGKVDIIVGTHRLLSKDVAVPRSGSARRRRGAAVRRRAQGADQAAANARSTC